MGERDPKTLLDEAAAGDRAALGRLLTLVERGGQPARAVARLVQPRVGRAYTIGLTGAPGAGKSTLTDALLHHVRRRSPDAAIGVLAVDPSSPRTGGAILGDRLRMPGHADDEAVFIRSMASRGHLGGVTSAVPQAVRVLDAAGIPLIVVETVGVGQVEVAIAGSADTTVVVVTPGWGDSVQVSKAGLLEVADVLVVNKADLGGAEVARQDLSKMLQLVGAAPTAWVPPIVAVTALDGGGVPALWDAVAAHRAHLEAGGQLANRRRSRVAAEVREMVQRRLELQAATAFAGSTFDHLVDEVIARRLDPFAAADALLSTDGPATTEGDQRRAPRAEG